MDLRVNLERIRRGEVEEWLCESIEKYRYPVCGSSLSVSAMGRSVIIAGGSFRVCSRIYSLNG